MSIPTAVGTPVRRIRSLRLPAVRDQQEQVDRIADLPLTAEAYRELQGAQYLGVTDEFLRVIEQFPTPAGHTPAGFRVELELQDDGVVRADLVRDISVDADNVPRPTRVLFSADSANPYEVEPIAPLIANLTCNPGIIYDLFINNPKANIDHKYNTRDEVMAEIGRILGPGCDISVELNNPFEPDFGKILEECEKFREMLSPWRVVIKVPHTGPVNADNVGQLLSGNARLDKRWYEPATADSFMGHNLALKLHEHGFRVNFTLMFDPHQTLLALQARPYFINSFIRHRLVQTTKLAGLLDEFEASQDEAVLATIRDYLVETDNLASTDAEFDPQEARRMAERLVAYRRFRETDGADGLDGVRHNLRVLRGANLPDTRLILCSMEGPTMYPDIDRMLAEPEFEDMLHKVVITAEPGYLARFASDNQVVSYQRRFMKAAQGQS